MLYSSLFLLASAGAAIAQAPAACESLTNTTELLQDDDGKVYCSSILSLGTVTNTLIESTTTSETTTITTPSEITQTETTTQTETISSGTVTETAPLSWVTETSTTSTTEYACPTFFRRGLEAYAVDKTTSAPEPTSAPGENDCEDEDLETSPVEYDYHSPAYITVYPPSAPQGQVLTLSYSSHSTVPSNVQYSQAYGNVAAAYPSGSSYSHLAVANNAQYSQAYGSAPAAYTSGSIGASVTHSTYVSAQPHISSNSTIHYTGGVTASSRIPLPHVSGNSTIIPTGGPTASSVISTTSSITTSPIVTPTPTPKPSCETAPTALRTGFACDAVNAACSCLGLVPATEDVTSTTTFSEAVFLTETMMITTTTTLTETEYTTVPEVTLTESPSSTVTATATATATVCPCSGSTSSLCGTTADTCKDLQSDVSNCGSCGNTCGDGQTCSAGVCKTPAIPNVLKCAASQCSNYIRCSAGNSCLCVATVEGTGACVLPSTSCGNKACNVSSDCGTDEVCAIKTCCRGGGGICIMQRNVCPNDGSTSKMFRRKTWDGETVGGGM